MSIERDSDSTPRMFGGPDPNEILTPLSPETARILRSTGNDKHWEAHYKQMEAEWEPDVREKERNWAFRVILDRKNGWKPIWPDSAKDEELRIYTLLDTFEHRFWGIKPIGMTMDEFWHKYDPEVKRYHDRQQETPVNPDAPVGELIGEPPKSLTTEETAAKPVKRRASKAKAATKDVTMPPKHPRGRLPVEKKPSGRLPKQKKMPAVMGNGGFIIPQEADRPRPLVPSIHKMRTRQDGPTQFLRLP